MDIIGGVQEGITRMRAERNYKTGKYENALKQYLHLFETSLKGDNKPLAAKYAEKIGDCYERLEHKDHKTRIEDHKNAGGYYIKSADILKKTNKTIKAGEIYEKGAKAYEEIDDFKTAGDFYLESATMFTQAKDFVNASYAYHKAAEYFEKDGKYQNAARAYREATVCDLKIRDTTSAAEGFKKAAENYERAKDWEKAIDNRANSIQLDTMNRKYLDIADTYEKIAEDYYEKDDTKNAIHYHLKSANLRAMNNEEERAASSYRHIGTVQENNKQYDEAITYYQLAAKTYFKKGKNSADEADCYIKAGNIYEKLGKTEQAAKSYFEAMKAQKTENEGSYEISAKTADLYMTAAKQKTDQMESGMLTLKAAQIYDDIKEFEKAADAYTRYAQIMSGDKEKESEGYSKAAQEYLKVKRYWEAAQSLVNNEQYSDATTYYEQQAQQKEEEKDYFGAGLANMENANCYRRIRNEALMKIRLDRAINNFTKYFEKNKESAQTKEDYLLLGDALRKTGECEKILDQLDLAQIHMKKARENYIKTGDGDRIDVTDAQSMYLEGVKSIDRGNYTRGEELLKKSSEKFEKLASTGAWKREYTKILAENAKDAREIIEKIKLKPEVNLEIDQRSYTFTNMSVIINVRLSNNGKYTMKGINFLEHLPEDITLTRLPEKISELEPGKTERSSIELTPKTNGLKKIKPLEVYYEDQKGHRYVKSSSEITIEVVETPPTDYKNYMKSTTVFEKYAKSQEENKNWFQAGDGYRQIAGIWGKFHNDERLTQYLTKSSENYGKYIQENQGKAENPTQTKRLADAHWNIAESMRGLKSLESAAEEYLKAAIEYENAAMPGLAHKSNAMNQMVKGENNLKSGDYENGQRQLRQAVNMLKETEREEGIKEFLDKNIEAIETMLNSVETEPKIKLTVSCPQKAARGQDIVFHAILENPLKTNFIRIRPSITFPENMTLTGEPDNIEELPPGKIKTISFKIAAQKPGRYQFKPFEISYEDENGNAYMRSGNEVDIDITDEHEKEKPDESTPEVNLRFSDVEQATVGVEHEIKGTVSNDGEVEVVGLKFIGNNTEYLEVIEPPETISALPPKTKKEVSVRIKPKKEGTIAQSLVELFYKNNAGKRFFKSSQKTTIKTRQT